MLERWDEGARRSSCKVMPTDYKRVLDEQEPNAKAGGVSDRGDRACA